ncbi:MFS transporter [Companilactobacillus hulinensis]|uniref:MFS transporter n=1 Tax=Companilactobacillus hulinensis TaxID=2486007 RepID=UPI000F78854D|nr:MFS transporter [Companilactobacillus hulinensis]
MTQSKTSVIAVTIAIYIATFFSSVEGTLLSTALPTIVSDLQGVSLMSWVFSAFLLVTAMFTPIIGRLTDLIGRKPVIQSGLAIYIIALIMSGLSNSIYELVFWRSVQGIGAASLAVATITLVADLYPYEERPKVLGLNNLIWAVATLSGPLIGGIVVNEFSWHWIFFVSIPFRLLMMVIIQVFLHEPKKRHKVDLDLLGSFWLMISVLFLMLSFQYLGRRGVDWIGVLIFWIISAVTLWIFVRHEKRVKEPVVPLKLFKNKPFMRQNIISALVNGYLAVITVYIPIWVQGILGTPVSIAGYAVTPNSIFWVVGSFVTSYLLARWTPRRILRFGLSFILLAGLLLVFIPMTTGFGWFMVITSISGFGIGIAMVTTTVEAQHLVSKEDVGLATGFNTLSHTLGQTVLVSVFGILMNVGINNGIDTHPGTNLKLVNEVINPKNVIALPKNIVPMLREVLFVGLHWIYIFGVIVIILAIIINHFGVKSKVKE